MGFPRQEYWSGLPLPSPGDIPDRRMEPAYPVLAGGFFTTEPPGNRISALIKETLESSLQRKNSHLWIKKLARTRPSVCWYGALILNFPAFRTVSKKCLLLINHSGYFLTEPKQNKTTIEKINSHSLTSLKTQDITQNPGHHSIFWLAQKCLFTLGFFELGPTQVHTTHFSCILNSFYPNPVVIELENALECSGSCVCVRARVFWLSWVFIALRGLSLVAGSRGVWASHCDGLSRYGEQALGKWVSVVVVHKLSCSEAYGIFLDQNWTHVPCNGRQLLIQWATREILDILLKHKCLNPTLELLTQEIWQEPQESAFPYQATLLVWARHFEDRCSGFSLLSPPPWGRKNVECWGMPHFLNLGLAFLWSPYLVPLAPCFLFITCSQPWLYFRTPREGTSLAGQWLRIHASTAGGVGSIPGRGTKILHASWCRQKSKERRITRKKKKKNCQGALMKYQSLHHISLSPDLICLGCGLGMDTVSFTQLTARGGHDHSWE